MKIVIEIPEERYEFIKGLDNTCYDIHTAIAQGIPLPKGRGDLISREDLKKAVYVEFGNSNLTDAFNDIIDNAPTVIPVDK